MIAATHWLGSIAAFGSTMLALPVLVWFLDIKDARTVLLLIGTVQCYQVFTYVHRDINWRLVGRMSLFAGLGLPIGICALRFLPEAPLLVFLGIVLLASGVAGLRTADTNHARRWPPAALDALLFVGGIIHGAFVCGGPALVVYAQHMSPEKGAFRASLTAFWAVVNTVLVAVLLSSHWNNTNVTPILAAGIPLVLLVSCLGNITAKRLSQRHFMKLVAVLLITASLITIARALHISTTPQRMH